MEDRPLEVVLTFVVGTVAEVFGAQQVALLLPEGGALEVVASAGEPLSEVRTALDTSDRIEAAVTDHGPGAQPTAAPRDLRAVRPAGERRRQRGP